MANATSAGGGPCDRGGWRCCSPRARACATGFRCWASASPRRCDASPDMSFDYKQLSPSLRPDSSGSFLIGLFFGFLLGLGVAAGIAIYFFKTPIPFTDKTRVPEKAPPAGQGTPPPPPSAPGE